MKYNIFKLEEEGPAFDVKVGVFRSRTNRNRCDLRTIEVCARYNFSFTNFTVIFLKKNYIIEKLL